METKLKPCPFCGEEVVEEYDSDWGLIVRCLECPAIMTESPNKRVFDVAEAWNTRHEQTCHVNKSVHDIDGSWHYLSCGHRADTWLDDPPNYCPDCGRRIKEATDANN